MKFGIRKLESWGYEIVAELLRSCTKLLYAMSVLRYHVLYYLNNPWRTVDWVVGWLGFNGTLSTQVAAISCLRKLKVY